MDISPEELWSDQRRWPLTPPGYVFIVPAFNRIGRHLYGDSWHDEFPAKNPFPLPPPSPNEADTSMRAWAHAMLSHSVGDYGVDYREPTAKLGSLAALGQVSGSRRLLQLDDDPANTDSLADQSAEQTGYRFTEDKWEKFRAIVHYQNELMKPDLEKVRRAARWLYDAVFSGALAPFLMRQGGGDWRASEPDDWMMPDLDRLRLRVRYARMVPGQAGSMAGSHWIFLPEAALDAALQTTAKVAVGAPSQDNTSATSGPSSSDDSANAITTTAMVKQAKEHVAELLRMSPNVTRGEAFASVRKAIGAVSDNQLRQVVWPEAREAAGLPRKAASGRKRRAAEKSDG